MSVFISQPYELLHCTRSLLTNHLRSVLIYMNNTLIGRLRVG